MAGYAGHRYNQERSYGRDRAHLWGSYQGFDCGAGVWSFHQMFKPLNGGVRSTLDCGRLRPLYLASFLARRPMAFFEAPRLCAMGKRSLRGKTMPRATIRVMRHLLLDSQITANSSHASVSRLQISLIRSPTRSAATAHHR
jgi:hypothetical protein